MTWESKATRETFLEFFEKKGHKRIKSSSLIPSGDRTILFTNAGMVQFKDYFTGKSVPPFKRATSCQKCMRAGGKHNDLENVGRTGRHHTFFEMLGNFSFGDYFKEEAIEYAWELVTSVFKLPGDRLYISVHEKDDESFKIWNKNIGIPQDRIFKLGDKDNFWAMGDVGPCGPCSEIYFDRGKEFACGNNCGIGRCDCDRFLEIWNLVFMQYERKSDGTLENLPHPSVDTGMGLERITSVLQNAPSNYETDLFIPIINWIMGVSGKSYGSGGKNDISIRVIADHLRAICFLIADGCVPSNEGRGYVLRRIIRRALRHGFVLGINKEFLHSGTEIVVKLMGDVYPELKENAELISETTFAEEARFKKVLERGMLILGELIESARAKGQNVLPGKDAFKLYDTYGFPVDMIEEIVRDEGMEVDMQSFNLLLQEQKERARMSRKIQGESVVPPDIQSISKNNPTLFTGYTSLEESATVIAILKDGKLTNSISSGESGTIILNRTPFYAEKGGQVGDTGVLEGTGRAIVTDTQHITENLTGHNVKVVSGTIKVNDTVLARVDADRRSATARAHTATHLLHRALKEILGEHVRQAGSLVEPDRLRFDFTHPEALTDEQIKSVEKMVFNMIVKNIEVKTQQMSYDEAIKKGAIALFGEKYTDVVRVVSISDFSVELCGGTHVKRTGDIGIVKLTSQSSVASGVRRIEALTGKACFDYVENSLSVLSRAGEVLGASTKNLVEKIVHIKSELKEKEREIDRLRGKILKLTVNSVLDNAVTVDDVTVITARIDNRTPKELLNLADMVRDRIKQKCAVLLVGQNDGKKSILVALTKDLSNKFNAGELIKQVLNILGGRGGGRRELAQGSINDFSKLNNAFKTFRDSFKR